MSDFVVKQTKKTGEPSSRIVSVTGPMTISYASELKKALLKGFKGCGHLYLDLTRVDEVDLTGLQLICSAHRSAILNDKQFSIAGEFPEPLSVAARDAGFVRQVGCEKDVAKSCVWCGGNR